MRIEIVEIVDPAGAAGRQSWRAEISRLHDDQDCLGHQRPAAGQKSQTFADAKALEYRKKLAAPDRDAPTVVAGVHVDGNDAAERRLEQRQPARPRQIAEFTDEIVRRLAGPGLAKSDDERHPVGPDIEHAGLRIDRSTSPIAAAADTGYLNRATLRRRREQRAMIVFGDDIDRFLAKLRREIDQILIAQALNIDRRGLGGERLRLRRALARHIGGRHRLLLDRPHRLAGCRVETGQTVAIEAVAGAMAAV